MRGETRLRQDYSVLRWREMHARRPAYTSAIDERETTGVRERYDITVWGQPIIVRGIRAIPENAGDRRRYRGSGQWDRDRRGVDV